MPRRLKNVWPDIANFLNLYEAYRDARRGKRYTDACLKFSWALESRLFDLEGRLVNEVWQPGRPYEFKVLEPKPRYIQAPPFADRVVHQPWCVRSSRRSSAASSATATLVGAMPGRTQRSIVFSISCGEPKPVGAIRGC